MREIDLLVEHLDTDDDPELWRAALGYIVSEAEVGSRVPAEVGRCSYWLRPHSTRWKADGGFVCTTG